MFSSKPKFDANKCKVNLKMLQNRFALLQQKKTNLAKQQKRQVAMMLKDDKEAQARILVEHIIREDYTLESYELLRQYADLILARLNVVTNEPELKPEVAEAVCSLLYAGWLMASEVPELGTLNQLFTAKYGKPYAAEVIENKEKYLNYRLLRMLTSTQVPDPTVVELYLTEISKEEIADALERIVAGAAKEGAVMSEKKKRLVAYHEAGHAIVGALMPEYDPVTKISIVPRGAAGGLTFFAPSEERLESGLYSRTYLENQMAVAMGGRVAEELIFGAENVTTGASGDFQQVSRTARMMIEQMGFSDKIGQIALKSGGGQTFLGNDAGRGADYSQTTADIVDSEVQALVEVAYRRAKDLVQENIQCLHDVAEVLLDKENIDGDEFEQIMLKAKAKLYLKNDNSAVDVPFKTA